MSWWLNQNQIDEFCLGLATFFALIFSCGALARHPAQPAAEVFLPGPVECGLTNPARTGRQQQKIADKLIAAKGVKHGKLTVTTTGKDLPS